MGQFKDYMDLDEHPFTGLRKLSMPFKARIKNTEYIRNFFDGTPNFIELVKVYKIKPLKIGYDRYSANYLVEDLKTAGFHTDDVYQGTNLTPILHEFEGNLKDGLFDFGDNSMLAAHFLNVAVDINLNDSRMKPVKIEKRMRIDGAMSVFDALTMVSKYHNEIGKKLLNISKETA